MPAYVAIDAFDKVVKGIRAYTEGKGSGYSPEFGWHVKWHPMDRHPMAVDRFHVKDEEKELAAYYLFEIPLQYVYPGPNRGACLRTVYEGTDLKIGTADRFATAFIDALRVNGLILNDVATVEAGVKQREKDEKKKKEKTEGALSEKDRLLKLKRKLSEAEIEVPEDFPTAADLRADPEKAEALVDQAEMEVDRLLAPRPATPPVPIGMTMTPGAVPVLAQNPAAQNEEPPRKKAKSE